MPYGLEGGQDGSTDSGETFEWALQTDACGDCVFYEESGGTGACSVHEDRPLICQTYPFSIALGGTSQPMGEAVDQEGMVRAHECEGLGRDISRDEARDLAETLKERAVRELTEALGVRDTYAPIDAAGVVVHDSEGAKEPDGVPLDTSQPDSGDCSDGQ
jgi:Fe-S-cluster containining protein